MKTFRLAGITGMAVVAMTFSACETPTRTGAVVGAVTGAGIGAIAGGSVGAAAIGGAAGAGAGALAGHVYTHRHDRYYY